MGIAGGLAGYGTQAEPLGRVERGSLEAAIVLIALAALPAACEAAIVALSDGPDLAPAAIERVIATC